MVEMQSITSSMIQAIGYDEPQKVMRVQFNSGEVYDYQNVDEETYHKIMQAPSVGSVFTKLIKKKPDEFPFQKVS